MKSYNKNPLQEHVVVDELIVGLQEEYTKGRKLIKKKLVVFGIEKKGKGVSRVYGKVISKASSKELGDFMREKVKIDANIKTDAWLGYAPLKNELVNLKMGKSEKKGKNFGQIHRVIMGFKCWLRGIHHHVEHLQSYIDEYTYRFIKIK